MFDSGETLYLFRHAMLRDAAYELQPPSVRAALHAETVLVFESMFGGAPPADSRLHHVNDPFVGEIALHAMAAAAAGHEGMDDIRDAYLRRAGLLADRQCRHDDAERFWSLLLANTAQAVNRVQALHRLGHVAMDRQQFAEARDYQKRAVEMADGFLPEEYARVGRIASNAKISLSYIDYYRGEISRAVALAREVVVAAEDPEIRSVALRALGGFQLRGGEPAQSIQTFHQAIDALGDSARPDQLADLLGSIALAELELNRIDEALAHFDGAIELARSSNHRKALAQQTGNKAAALRAAGREHEAMEQMRRSMELARENGDRPTEVQALGNLCNARTALGETEGVEDDYRRVVGVVEEIGSQRSISLWTGNLAMYQSAQGRRAEAEKNLARALAIAREIGEPGLHGGWLCNYGVHFERLGEREAALRYWREGANILRDAAPRVLREVCIEMRKLCAERDVDFDKIFGT